MSRSRADTATKEPHSVSLKVLRLSRPSLALQHPLPRETTASLSLPPSSTSSTSDNDFILSHNLNLPSSFGSAYVGETFACSLCANNELPSIPTSPTTTTTTHPTKTVTNIKLLAEMQTPTSSLPLALHPPPPHTPPSPTPPTTQHIITHPLREEGTHILAVNVTYTETTFTSTTPTSSRTRSFRKLYQFPSVPCLSVRTKATELPPLTVPDPAAGPYNRITLHRYTLEAQLENVSDGAITLESAVLSAKAPFVSTSLNPWDNLAATTVGIKTAAGKEKKAPMLAPRDVHQLSYLVTQRQGETEGLEEMLAGLKRDGRVVLGQLGIEWRGGMGERGSLSTGGLMSRRRVGV